MLVLLMEMSIIHYKLNLFCILQININLGIFQKEIVLLIVSSVKRMNYIGTILKIKTVVYSQM